MGRLIQEQSAMGKNLFTAKQFIAAIPGSGGIISTIAKRVGCDWDTAKKYLTEMPTVNQAWENEKERVDDMAESTLIKSIQEGNTQDAKWWLARVRREKFGDNVDVTTAGQPLTIVRWDDANDDN
jgi:hypothetical protein